MEYIYSEKNESLEQVVVNILKKENISLSVAESCTGGMISKKITDIAGASKIYKGGIIAYSNELKIKLLGINSDIIKEYGAVSNKVAGQMADSIKNKTKSDIGIATTGISGPSGATAGKDIGIIFIAVSYNETILVKKFNLIPKRNIHRETASSIALNMIRKIIK